MLGEKINNIEIPDLFPEASVAGVGSVEERKTLSALFSAKDTGNVGKGASESERHVDDVKIPENMKKWDYSPSDELYKKYENVYKNPKYYDQKTGGIHWPPNDGFVSGTQKVETLQPGTRLDIYGNTAGSFLAPESDSFPSRALAPHSE
ncbi:hypothetical protein IKQ_06112 [Bacillus cereus VDM053]|nr:hypothetical protein IKQ_06112 [Bacillus cereus VDM053]